MLTHTHRRSHASLPDEVEALQTDVMRFMAIICMCLVVVFALVKSIPVSNVDNMPELTKTSAFLEDEISALEALVKKLDNQIVELEKKIELRQKALEELSGDLKEGRTALRALQSELALTLRRISQARKEKEKAGEKAREAREELNKKMQQLDVINSYVVKGWEAAHKAKKTVEAAKKHLEDTLKKKTVKQKDKSAPPKKVPQQYSPKKKGFTLKFFSNEALNHLLAVDGRVKLYLIAGGRNWLLTGPGGRWKFVPSNAPGYIYEMDFGTVPYDILKAGEKVVAAFGKGALIYGVTLPSDIRGNLGHYMADRQGGDLIIHKNGMVTCE